MLFTGAIFARKISLVQDSSGVWNLGIELHWRIMGGTIVSDLAGWLCFDAWWLFYRDVTVNRYLDLTFFLGFICADCMFSEIIHVVYLIVIRFFIYLMFIFAWWWPAKRNLGNFSSSYLFEIWWSKTNNPYHFKLQGIIDHVKMKMSDSYLFYMEFCIDWFGAYEKTMIKRQ